MDNLSLSSLQDRIGEQFIELIHQSDINKVTSHLRETLQAGHGTSQVYRVKVCMYVCLSKGSKYIYMYVCMSVYTHVCQYSNYSVNINSTLSLSLSHSYTAWRWWSLCAGSDQVQVLSRPRRDTAGSRFHDGHTLHYWVSEQPQVYRTYL